jgi:hypothetical protein
MPLYIVEHEYAQPLSEEAHKAEMARADPCLRQYEVTWKASYLAVDRMKMVCIFEAENAEQVRSAMRSGDIPFAKVWATYKFSP